MSAWVVRIQGWKKAHERVAFVKLVRETRRVGLRDAKALMEKVGARDGLVFDFADEATAQAFAQAARGTGAVVWVGQTS